MRAPTIFSIMERKMKLVLHPDIRIRKEEFGSILLVPLELERPEIPQFFKVNKIGTIILEHCRSPIILDNLIKEIRDKYKTDNGEDIKIFVNHLVQVGILRDIKSNHTMMPLTFPIKKEDLRNTPKLSSPLSAFVELSDKCVLKCIHCYTRSENKPIPSQQKQWISDILCHLSEIGVLTIGFGGGEPTLDPNLSSYIKYCSSVGIKTAISTSGVLVTDAMAFELKESGLGIAQISIDGTLQIHDHIRGKGTYKKAINALELFSKLGVETRVAMTVSAVNWGYIAETAESAFKHGSDRFVVFRYMPSGRGGARLSLSREELKKITEQLIALQESHPETVIGYEPLCFYPHLIKNDLAPLSPCNAGSDILNICADGTVTPCPHIRNYWLGKYPEESLNNIWERAKVVGRNILFNPPDECIGCRFVKKCGGGCSWNLRDTLTRKKDIMCWQDVNFKE